MDKIVFIETTLFMGKIVYLVINRNSQIVSLLDYTIAEQSFKFHFLACREAKVRLHLCLLHPEGIIVVTDSKSLLLSGLFACQVLSFKRLR